MRILVWGMQSSGASLITFFIAQNDHFYAIIDNDNNSCPPQAADENMIVKCTTNPRVPFSTIKTIYKPDKTVLVIRDPIHNYLSLVNKKYGNNIWEKFAYFDRVFTDNHFDVVIKYEDFIHGPQSCIDKLNTVGIPVNDEFLKFKRSPKDIKYYNRTCQSLRYMYRLGIGNIHHTGNNIEINKNITYRKASPRRDREH